VLDDLAVGERGCPGGQVVGVVAGALALVELDDRLGDVVGGDDVDAPVGAKGRTGRRASMTKARTMSNWVVSGKRLSPRTMLGRKTTVSTSGSSSWSMCSQNFLVRA
jgi:hypothetical protein